MRDVEKERERDRGRVRGGGRGEEGDGGYRMAHRGRDQQRRITHYK